MHAKETDIDTVNLFKDKHGLGAIREGDGEIPLKSVFHQRTCVEGFVTGGHDAYGDIACIRFLGPEETVDTLFEVQC